MEAIRYIPTHLKIQFAKDEDSEYKKEFDFLALSDEDAVGEWLKLAKARGETSESDQVLLTLVVELHRKIDSLTNYIKGEKLQLLDLKSKTSIDGMGYEHLRVEESLFEIGQRYYARVEMPVFPKREIPLFIEAINSNEAAITLIHERDEKDWSAYLVARERSMIREMRANKDRES